MVTWCALELNALVSCGFDNSNKVVKITSEYFETEDGRVFYHETPLEIVPTLEEFQEMYDKAEKFFKEDE